MIEKESVVCDCKNLVRLKVFGCSRKKAGEAMRNKLCYCWMCDQNSFMRRIIHKHTSCFQFVVFCIHNSDKKLSDTYYYDYGYQNKILI